MRGRNWCAPNVQTKQRPGVDPMEHLVFHNVYLRGIGILLLIEMVFFLLTIRNRKPGTSSLAAAFGSKELTERGLRAKWWCDLFSGLIILWFVVAVVLKAVMTSGLIG
jgi:hypothetical protein